VSFRDQGVWITGASSGIGEACARRWARDGLRVVLAARRLERLEAIAAEIRADGGEALPLGADVTQAGDLDHLVARALERFGRIDVAVCNAGISFYGRLDETTPEVVARLVDVNLLGTLRTIRAVLPHFRDARRGHVLIVSSILGRRAIPGSAAYAASKFAQVGLGEALRTECAGTGIDVSLVYPVSTDTGLRDAMRRDFGVAVQGLGPRQSAEHVAEVMLRAVRRPRPEVFPYWPSRLVPLLTTLAPRLADRVVQRFERRRQH
jgi:NADP-dependent 3-hydroxy acid dehydrogenase YdfG